jgi:hypothetical protein
MKNEDTTGVVKPQMKGQTIAKRNETKKHTMNYKTIHIKLKIWGESSSCSTSGACRVILVTNPVICHKWGKDRNISSNSSGFTSYLNISFFFTQRLTLRRIPRTSDAYDNPLTSCSIPYTDLRAIIMNYVLKRWQDSWDQKIYNKLLVILCWQNSLEGPL